MATISINTKEMMGPRSTTSHFSRALFALLIVLLLSVSFVLSGCQRANDNIEATNLHEVASPAVPDSDLPNLAVGPGGETYLSWVEYTDAGTPVLKFATNTDSGWSEPRIIVQGDDLVVNYADFPSIVAVDKNLLAAHWMSQIPDKDGYNVNIALSHDGGQHWSKPVIPHRDGTPTEHGFVSITPDISGGIAAIWFDGRKVNGETGADDVAMMYARISPDGAAGEESVVADRVCECCQMSAVAVPGGILAVYRDRSREEIRDIAITRFDGHAWSQPKTVFADNWELYACPINGPAIAADGGNVAVAWFTAVNDKPKVVVALSADSGSTFGPPVQIDDGNPIGRVDVVMLESGRAVVSWLERTDKGADLRARVALTDTPLKPSLVIAATTPGTSSGFPRMERASGGIVFAWTDTDQARVRTAILQMAN